jgi:hypothetical protein
MKTGIETKSQEKRPEEIVEFLKINYDVVLNYRYQEKRHQNKRKKVVNGEEEESKQEIKIRSARTHRKEGNEDDKWV